MGTTSGATPGAAARWLLYGANGYTGSLIAEHALERGLRPVLGARRAAPLEALARRLDPARPLPTRVFALRDRPRLEEALAGVDAVLLAAGPFVHTFAPVLEACLRTGTHYLDITGEIPVFEACFAADAAARRHGVTVLPGVGFDVVPSDCVARAAADACPDADQLEIAFASTGRPSRGTSLTMLEHLWRGGAVRRGGRIVAEPVARHVRRVRFRDRERTVVSIPWGDVATAYRSTGIDNITVYTAAGLPPQHLQRLGPALRLLGLRPVRALLSALVRRLVRGPNPDERARGRAELWARATAPDGRWAEARATTPEGYRLTALAAVECMRRVLAGETPTGAQTPALAFGPGLLETITGEPIEIETGSDAGT